MKISVFRGMPDYRGGKRAISEINFTCRFGCLRFIAPTFGLSLWSGSHRQLVRFNYPVTG